MPAKKKTTQPTDAPDAIRVGEDEQVVAQRSQDMIDPDDMEAVEASVAKAAERAPTPESRPLGDPEERLGPGVDPSTSGSDLVGKGLVPSDTTLDSAPDLASRMAHENLTPAVPDDPNQREESR
jgi:hypothetical protein